MAIDTLLVFVGVYDDVASRRGDTGANMANRDRGRGAPVTAITS